MRFERARTGRGFMILNFKDLYDNSCSLQESSLASEQAIWLGNDFNRMHLNRRQSRQLAKRLLKFADTGKV